MKIAFSPWDEKSVAEATEKMKRYAKEFADKSSEFARRLAEIGVEIAKAGFATADYDGTNDVVVGMAKTENGYAVVASGETVGFIEFGTGVRYPEWDGTDTDYTPPKHGTYGKGQGKNPGYWFFGSGRYTCGNPPAEAMLTARDVMIERVVQIAREVWNA